MLKKKEEEKMIPAFYSNFNSWVFYYYYYLFKSIFVGRLEFLNAPSPSSGGMMCRYLSSAEQLVWSYSGFPTFSPQFPF